MISYINKILILTGIFLLSAMHLFCQKTAVYFKNDVYVLDAKAVAIIDSLAKINGIKKILLHGHCDSVASYKYNEALALKRVNAVRARFVSAGIKAEIIQTKASGKRAPLNNNANETERALNRRVEIELVLTSGITNLDDTTPVTNSSKSITNDEVELTINGIVVNDKYEPLVAEITLSDMNGKEIKTFKSDKKGKFKFISVLNKREDYSLTFYSDSTFVSTKTINAIHPDKPFKNLKAVLPKLKEGNKYLLENMNFVGDTSQLVPASVPTMENLYKVMKRNKNLVIQIEGHVNYPYHWPDPQKTYHKSIRYVPPGMNQFEFNQWLSDHRANAVRNYLIERGIDAKRVTTIGFGAAKMLYPNAVSEDEMAKNRRVEIHVISYKLKY
ncbi:MAG: OmpA family protein [Bacteroidetes bacterium]|nr:OmpA family protein [Bacteroidota bacterium]